jgi:hypothetical protein
MEDDSPFQQQQIPPPGWDSQCHFCQRHFVVPGSLTKHLNGSCPAARKGLKKRLSQAQSSYAAKKQARLDQRGAERRKKWYEMDNLDVDMHASGLSSAPREDPGVVHAPHEEDQEMQVRYLVVMTDHTLLI